MLNLVLVSSGTIVRRHFEITDAEILREIVGDITMMRQVLVLKDDAVIFEALRGEGKQKWRVPEIRDMLRDGKIIRRLTEKEKRALACVRYASLE